MTEDERLDDVIRRTLAESRRPPEPPLDAMWADIEQRAFDNVIPLRIYPAREWRWLSPALAAAAALIVGTGLGWSLAPRQIITRVIPAPAQMASTGTRNSPATAQNTNASPQSTSVERTARSLPAEYVGNTAGARNQRGSDAGVTRLASQFDDVANGSGMGRYLAQTSALLASLPSDRTVPSDTTIALRASDLLTQTHLLLDSRAGSDPTLHRLLEDLELVLAQVARLRVERNGTDLQMIHQAITVHDVLPRVHDASLEASITD